MEQILPYLGREEKILWKRTEIRDQSFTSPKSLLKYLSPFYLTILVVLVLKVTVGTVKIFAELYMLLMLAAMLLFLYHISKGDKKKLRDYNLTRTKLIHYEKTWALTKKRWIQKNLDWNTMIYPDELPPNAIEKIDDMIFVNLECIKAVLITVGNLEKYEFLMYVDESFTEYSNPNIGIELESKGEYDDFMHIFKKYVPLDEPEEEDVGDGIKFIYHLREN